MAKQTAVQFLVMRYHQWQGVLKDIDIEEAKAMEKEQIMMAYDYGEANEYRQNINNSFNDDINPEQYYKKTYENNK
jgi:hypothetical protein